ncbi:MAG TPA: hypothetical protein PKC43_07065 [Phycisphaerales bacterium]|nr:hypothetical protein [Phycisphaerales bacterium]HMP37194.1 hypothetical protein [Phycisphaerales bacterium]
MNHVRRPIIAATSLVLSLSCAATVLGQGAPPGGQRGPEGRGGWGPPDGDRPAMRRGGGMFRGMAGFTDVMQPEFISRDLALFRDALALDQVQSTVVDLLIRDYEEAFRTGIEPVTESLQELGPALMRTFMSPQIREQMRAAMERTQAEIREQIERSGVELAPEEVRAIFEERMPAAMEQIRVARIESGEDAEGRRIMGQMITALDAWRAERERLRQAFIESLRVQLSDEQMADWPGFERLLLREKSLGRGRLSGESTDILAILDTIDLDDETFAAIEPTLDAFELRLHEALRARNDYLAQSEPRLLRAVQELDVRQGLDIVRRQIQFRTRVRDVNDEGRVAIAAALPAELSDWFNRAVLADAFERVYRPTRVDSALDYVRSLDLSPELSAHVDALELAYRAELRGADERVTAVIKRQEPIDELRQAERFAGFLTGDFRPSQAEDPVRDAMRLRRELVDLHADRILAVLSPEQRDAMPGGGGGGARRGDGRGDVMAVLDELPREVRQRILDRVDANRNGRIDPEEQAEAERMMREGRGGGWWGGGRGGEGRGDGGGGGEGRRNRDREL